MNTNELIEILSTAPNDFASLVSEDQVEMIRLDDALASLAVKAAELSGYISARIPHQDQGEARAQAKAARRRRAVRKALGFTYP